MIEVSVELAEMGASAAGIAASQSLGDLERVTLSLRRELADSEAETVALVPGSPSPENAKGASIAPGALRLQVSSSGNLASVLSRTLDWASRHEEWTVTLKIGGDPLVLNQGLAATPEGQIRDWLRRHSLDR